MTTLTREIDWTAGGELVRRCTQLGFTVVTVDTGGSIRAVAAAGKPDRLDLNRLVSRSALFGRSLSLAVRQWQGRDDVEPTMLWPGCWIVPLPWRLRRRCLGYRVALLLTPALPASEQFVQVLGEAGLDRDAALAQCASQPLPDEPQVHRIAHLLRWMNQDVEHQQGHDLEIDTLSQQLSETYEELSLVYKLSAGMTVTQEPKAFLRDAMDELQQVVGLHWIALQLNETDDRLGAMRGELFIAGQIPCTRARISTIARQLMIRCGNDQCSRIIEDVSQLGIDALTGLARHMLLVPLVREERLLGFIVGADKINDGELCSVDSKLITSLGQSIGIFLENAMLYEDVQDMFMGTLRSLVNAIDAKDTYTCGHSERVAWLGRSLAEAAGLDSYTVERLHLAGLLHDVGKIGVPEAVLTKPGRLTDREFAIIKTHPRIGGRILQGIRQMQDLIPGVLYHHERYDGKGYPDGLAGDNIPLFGRVLCLADSFDAMSSTRTYREALPLNAVLDEIHRCAGSQFDPHLAEVFVDLDFAEYHQMVLKHQQRQSLLGRELREEAPA